MTSARIGFVVKTFPKLSETFVLGEVLGLEGLGVPLAIFALRKPVEALRHAKVQQVRAVTHYLDDGWGWFALVLLHLSAAIATPLRYARALRLLLWRGEPHPWLWLAQAIALSRTARRAGVTHLHAHFAVEPATIAQVAALLMRAGYSVSAHAKDIYTSPPALLRARLAQARFVVTCTEFNRQHLVGVLGASVPVYRMYHGIDMALFRARATPAATPPLLLSVGRLREKKGFATLVRACALLRDAGTQFRCEIVGYGEDESRLRALIQSLNLEDAVQLVGGMNHERLAKRYQDSTLFVLPCLIAADGDRDGIPNVLLEAMAAQLPVVTTPVSGIPEVVADDHNGVLVEPNDPTALARALGRLLEEPALRRRLGEAARATVARLFDNERNLRLIVRLFDQAHRSGPLTRRSAVARSGSAQPYG